MKKFLALTVFLSFFAAMTAMADPNNTDIGRGQFNANVSVLITITPDNTQGNLGDIAPGSSKTFAAETKYVGFTVDGAAGWSFTAFGVANKTCTENDVTLDELKWQFKNAALVWEDLIPKIGTTSTVEFDQTSAGFPYFNLSGVVDNSSPGGYDPVHGSKLFRVCCTKISAIPTADMTSASLRQFDMTLTATYTTILVP